jgi:hypothetical protein
MNVELLVTALTHTIYGRLRRLGDGSPTSDGCRDRGAVSLEQVLWFVAAGVAVAVIAAILWGKIRDEANRPVVTPSAP